MNTTHELINIQQQRVGEHVRASDPHRFFNILTSERLFDSVESLLPEHRERRFPPTETLSLFLAQAMNADRSCQNVVNELAVRRMSHGLSPGSIYTGSYCKARQRIPLEMVAELARATGKTMCDEARSDWRWQGRTVKLIDGTTVTMPDTDDNQSVFPQQSGQKPGLGFPICRVLAVICLASGSVLNAAMGPFKGKGTSEQALLRTVIDTFKDGDIVLGDAYFASYFLIAQMRARGADILFEQYGSRKRSTDFRRGHKLGTLDHLITYDKPAKPDWMTDAEYIATPNTLTVRELKVGDKILVTTLLSPNKAPKQALKALYKSRWHVELDLRNIKTTLGMEVMSCKTPDMVVKEIWVYLLAYNLIRIAMAEAANLADILPRQLSFKHALQLWRAWRQSALPLCDKESLNLLFVLLAQNCVGNRPGRIEPRAVKRRPKAYPMLTQPRPLARLAVQKYGHPKQ